VRRLPGSPGQRLRGIAAAETLIAYRPGWYPWYLRLIADRPSNALVALRQVLPG